MQKLLCMLLIGTATVVTAIDNREIKKVIIVRQINGKTVVEGLDKVESSTLKNSSKQNPDKNIKVTIQIEQIQKNQPTSPADYRQF
jgi:hypothetical protein